MEGSKQIHRNQQLRLLKAKNLINPQKPDDRKIIEKFTKNQQEKKGKIMMSFQQIIV